MKKVYCSAVQLLIMIVSILVVGCSSSRVAVEPVAVEPVELSLSSERAIADPTLPLTLEPEAAEAVAADPTLPITLAAETDGLPFKLIARNYYCGWIDHAGVAVRTQKQLAWIWERFYQFSLYPPPLPKIDFESVMWIGVFRGQFSTWGYTIEIRSIREQQDAHNKFLRVEVLETNPSRWVYVKQEYSQPFHIVELARSRLPVRFTWKERTRLW